MKADMVLDGNKTKEKLIKDFEETIGIKRDILKLNKYQNMLLGIAIGDAFGAGYEMKSHSEILKDFNSNNYVRRGNSKINPGEYTDDTQMSIAVVELLLSNEKFTKENLAQKFIEAYHRDKREGYSSATKNGLNNSKSGKELLKNIKGDSIRNGACMRAVPIGLFKDIKDVVKYAIINSETTHNSPKGKASSVCVAAASHYFFYNLGKSKGVIDYCIEACKDIDNETLKYFNKIKTMKHFNPKVLFGKEHEKFGVPCDGMRTAGTALYILSRFSKSSKQTLLESVQLGGDVDSVASISLGIVSINQGIKELPLSLFYNLENGKYGRNYLIYLGDMLYKKCLNI